MDYSAVALYFAAVVAYAVSPGPMIAVIIARTVGGDSKGATALSTGVCMGFVIAVLAVAFGIGVWAQSRPDLFSVVKYFGVAYILWLAVGMWNGSAGTSSTAQQKRGWWSSVGAGIALCLGNPASLLFVMTLLPVVAPAGYVSVGQMTAVALVTFAGNGVVFFGAVLLARQLHGFVAKPASMRLFGRVTSGTLAMTSVWMLAH
jgi:threonine/homoserine/homoserine lactone efflux protein